MGGLTPCQDTADALLMLDENETKRVMDIGAWDSFQYRLYGSDRHFLTRLWHWSVVSSATISKFVQGINNLETLKVHRNGDAVPPRINPRY
jgi:hypothetical protein